MLSSSFLTSEPSLVKSLLKKVLPILSKPFLKGALQMRSYKKKKIVKHLKFLCLGLCVTFPSSLPASP